MYTILSQTNPASLYSQIPLSTCFQAAVSGFPPRRPGFKPGIGQVEFVVDKVALGQVFSEYFGFPCQFHSTKFSIIIITRGRYKRPFSGRRAEWTQLGLHPPLCELKKKLGLVLIRIIVPTTHVSPDWSLQFWISTKILYALLISLMLPTCPACPR
jgi:hypothetical protein